ncbi:GTPase Era, partial [bacterium]|nr:GTPase Era [bacterium]
RKRIKGIYTVPEGQIVFIDTPGIHKPFNKLGEFLLDEAKIAIPDTDLIIFLVDGTEPAGKGDKWIASNILKTNIPILIVMNKLDKIKKLDKVEENLLSYKVLFEKNLPILKISAKTGRNKETLLKNIFKLLPKGDLLYPEDVVTEETMRDVTEEIIREKILLNTSDEIPHSVAVMVNDYKESDEIDKIYATIYCEQKSQKGILIGKGGNLLKKIGTEARLELEKITEKKVFLSLEVKVEKDWRKKDKALKNFGYENIEKI